jgi:hypothetical protein
MPQPARLSRMIQPACLSTSQPALILIILYPPLPRTLILTRQRNLFVRRREMHRAVEINPTTRSVFK